MTKEQGEALIEYVEATVSCVAAKVAGGDEEVEKAVREVRDDRLAKFRSLLP